MKPNEIPVLHSSLDLKEPRSEREILDPNVTHPKIKMDAEEDSETPPATHICWFHAGHGLGHLDLLAAPVVAKPASAANTPWTGFTPEESNACEAAWQALSDAERAKALENDPGLGLQVAAPVINEDEEVGSGHSMIRIPPLLSLYSLLLPHPTRKSLCSVSLLGKSGCSRSMCARCVYATSLRSSLPPTSERKIPDVWGILDDCRSPDPCPTRSLDVRSGKSTQNLFRSSSARSQTKTTKNRPVGPALSQDLETAYL